MKLLLMTPMQKKRLLPTSTPAPQLNNSYKYNSDRLYACRTVGLFAQKKKIPLRMLGEIMPFLVCFDLWCEIKFHRQRAKKLLHNICRYRPNVQ